MAAALCARCMRKLRPHSSRSTNRQTRLMSSSAPTQTSPLLAKLRNDMKSALKASDKPRLAVLRSLIAQITNSSHTSTPIKSTPQLLAALRRRIDVANTTAAEFLQHGRQDLAKAEHDQQTVLQEIEGQLKGELGGEVSEADVQGKVEEVIESMKADEKKVSLGQVMMALVGEGGELEGRVEKQIVAKIAKEALAQGGNG